MFKNKKSILDYKSKIYANEKMNIYGAGLMGKALLRCLTDAPFHKKIAFFVVESMDNNPLEIEGIPVVDILNIDNIKDELLLVALHEKNMKKAINNLKKEGFTNIVPVSFDSDLWTEIRELWMNENQIIEHSQLDSLHDILKGSLSIYVVHSVRDKGLAEQVENSKYEYPILAGAALTDKVFYGARDDVGDNISEKNKQYCELTALYWIWKNDNSDYVGMCHYRRRFQLSELEAERLVTSDIDVVLTVPIVNFNTVRGQYETDHDIRDWNIMLEAIENLYPEYLSTANLIQYGNYYYAYNMFIARKSVVNSYCKWLFDILEYCEKRIAEKADIYQKRYAGFLAERLLTIYFTYNKQYKLVLAKKHFIESV